MKNESKRGGESYRPIVHTTFVAIFHSPFYCLTVHSILCPLTCLLITIPCSLCRYFCLSSFFCVCPTTPFLLLVSVPPNPNAMPMLVFNGAPREQEQDKKNRVENKEIGKETRAMTDGVWMRKVPVDAAFFVDMGGCNMYVCNPLGLTQSLSICTVQYSRFSEAI